MHRGGGWQRSRGVELTGQGSAEQGEFAGAGGVRGQRADGRKAITSHGEFAAHGLLAGAVDGRGVAEDEVESFGAGEGAKMKRSGRRRRMVDALPAGNG